MMVSNLKAAAIQQRLVPELQEDVTFIHTL
jgi:hypothetical protein